MSGGTSNMSSGDLSTSGSSNASFAHMFDSTLFVQTVFEMEAVTEFVRNIYSILEELIKQHLANDDPLDAIIGILERVPLTVESIEDVLCHEYKSKMIGDDRFGVYLTNSEIWMRDPQRSMSDLNFSNLCFFIEDEQYCSEGEALKSKIQTHEQTALVPCHHRLPFVIKDSLENTFRNVYKSMYWEYKFVALAGHVLPSIITHSKGRTPEYNSQVDQLIENDKMFDGCCYYLMERMRDLDKENMKQFLCDMAIKKLMFDVFHESNETIRDSPFVRNYHVKMLERMKNQLRACYFKIAYYFIRRFEMDFFKAFILEDMDSLMKSCWDSNRIASDDVSKMRDLLTIVLFVANTRDCDSFVPHLAIEYKELWKTHGRLKEAAEFDELKKLFQEIRVKSQTVLSSIEQTRDRRAFPEIPFSTEYRELKLHPNSCNYDCDLVQEDKVIVVFPKELNDDPLFHWAYHLHREAQIYQAENNNLIGIAQCLPIVVLTCLDNNSYNKIHEHLFKLINMFSGKLLNRRHASSFGANILSSRMDYVTLVMYDYLADILAGDATYVFDRCNSILSELTKILRTLGELAYIYPNYYHEFNCKLSFL